MKKVILILSVAAMFFGCAKSKESVSSEAVTTERPARELIAFGDSITSMPNSFAVLLANDINYSLNNQAVAGSQCQQEYQIDKIKNFNIRPQDIVVFLTGYNNLRTSGNSPDLGLSVYLPCLQEILKVFVKSGAQVYIGTTMSFQPQDDHVLYWNGPNATPQNSLIYSNEIKNMVSSMSASNLHVVDVNAGFNPSPTTEYDFAHPTPLGHRIIADLFVWSICGNVRPCVMP